LKKTSVISLPPESSNSLRGTKKTPLTATKNTIIPPATLKEAKVISKTFIRIKFPQSANNRTKAKEVREEIKNALFIPFRQIRGQD